MIDPDFKVDQRWPTYLPPSSSVAECVQRPAYLITPEAIIAAYMKDWRSSRKVKEAQEFKV